MLDLWKKQRERLKLLRFHDEEIREALQKNKNRQEIEADLREKDWEIELVDDEISAIRSDSLISRATKLDIPLQAKTDTVSWYHSSLLHRDLLTPKGKFDLRVAIDKERDRRFDAHSKRIIVLVTALTGLLGTATGLVAVLAKRLN